MYNYLTNFLLYYATISYSTTICNINFNGTNNYSCRKDICSKLFFICVIYLYVLYINPYTPVAVRTCDYLVNDLPH